MPPKEEKDGGEDGEEKDGEEKKEEEEEEESEEEESEEEDAGAVDPTIGDISNEARTWCKRYFNNDLKCKRKTLLTGAASALGARGVAAAAALRRQRRCGGSGGGGSSGGSSGGNSSHTLPVLHVTLSLPLCSGQHNRPPP